MHRPDNATAIAVKPDPAAAGTPGWFTNGNPATGVPATVVDADVLNDALDNLLKVLEVGNVSPVKGRREDLYDAITALSGTRVLSALDFPTVSTADQKVGVTGISEAGTGGKAVVPAGVYVTVAEEIVVGATGRTRTVLMPAWTSASLLASSTYYVRAYLIGGVLTPYVQRGADTDAIPAGLKGTPGAASGGGFDSTVFDVLCAKVTTGANGSVPTVLNLRNARVLFAQFTYTAGASYVGTQNYTLNWARSAATYTYATVIVYGGVAGSWLRSWQFVNGTRYGVGLLAEGMSAGNVPHTPSYIADVRGLVPYFTITLTYYG
jgi:hypothetical protein